MSYNISKWKTKEIKDLFVPMAAVHDLPYTEVLLEKDGTIRAEGLNEGFELVGRVIGTEIEIKRISTYGEGSGHTWDEFKNFLCSGRGSLVAIQIWEHGDSITRLIVKDGFVTQEVMEL